MKHLTGYVNIVKFGHVRENNLTNINQHAVLENFSVSSIKHTKQNVAVNPLGLPCQSRV